METTTETAPTNDLQVGKNEDIFTSEDTYRGIANSLGIEKQSDQIKYQDQIQRLAEWAKAKGAKDNTDIIWQIKQLANRIGGPQIGNNWAQHLSQYAYLELQRIGIDRDLRSLEKPNG